MIIALKMFYKNSIIHKYSTGVQVQSFNDLQVNINRFSFFPVWYYILFVVPSISYE